MFIDRALFNGPSGQTPSFSAMKRTASDEPDYRSRNRLLLPGAFLVAVGAQLFTPFVFVNFAFAAFF
jgi:hypothetical protein